MRRLENKTAIVTGGASGIGAATVKLFSEQGASVVIADIQEEAGNELAAALDGPAVFHRTDVTSEADVAAVVARAVSEFGHLDIMFNNAGSMQGRGSILEVEVDAFDRAVALLLRSVFLGMKHAGKALAAQGHGVILSTSSIAGLTAGGGPHVYATCKAAVIHLTKSVALELGESGVRVNCICPGGVATPLVLEAMDLAEDSVDFINEGMKQMQPIKRPGTTLDIARAALWLASDEADYVTGQAITVDGGEATGTLWSKQFMK